MNKPKDNNAAAMSDVDSSDLLGNPLVPVHASKLLKTGDMLRNRAGQYWEVLGCSRDGISALSPIGDEEHIPWSIVADFYEPSFA